MTSKMLPQYVADAFVKQYYVILDKCPENLHKFYQESSQLGWPGQDGVVTPVTTLTGINEKIMSTDLKNCVVEIKTTDAQESSDGGVIVAVTGSSTGKDNMKRNFSQTFFLAKQKTGFFVLNDILRFFDVCESITETAAKDNDINDQPAIATQNSVPQDITDSPKSPTKAVVKNGNVKEDVYPTLKDSIAKNASKSPVEKPRIIVALAENVKEDTKKITYASMVAKETRVTSPRTVLVTSNASPKAKSPAPLGDGAPKASHAPAVSRKVSPKLATPSNGAPHNGAYADVKGIYIGRLPYDISKQGIVEVVKQFGPVRRNADTIQIRRHDDGFCCGFVEFESADSARRAVEAHHVYFGDKEAYITYKKSSYNRGNDGRGRSPTRTGSGNSNFRGNGELISYGNGRFQNENQSGYSKGPRRNRSMTK